MSDVLTGPWWRILTMTAPDPAGLPASAEDDYAAIHSAAVAAARQGRPLVIAWLSRGDGAPLELITTAAPSAALPGAGRADSGGAAFPGAAPEARRLGPDARRPGEPEVGAPWGTAPTHRGARRRQRPPARPPMRAPRPPHPRSGEANTPPQARPPPSPASPTASDPPQHTSQASLSPSTLLGHSRITGIVGSGAAVPAGGPGRAGGRRPR